MSDAIDCVVIGAGVIGLAVARRLAIAGHEVVVLEAEPLIGSVTSSRNSEVIHAGIYYVQGSLKARLCVAGKHRLYAYCASHGVAHRRCGKLVVGSGPAEVERLEALLGRGHANGVDDLELIDGAAARRLEPALACDIAMISPSTGIVDSHGLMLALLGDLEDHGGVVALNAPFLSGEVGPHGIRIATGGDHPFVLSARQVVNAAGLAASGVAWSIEGLPHEHVPETLYAKGSYFRTSRRPPFSRLIYPAPIVGGLGIHLTMDMGGQCRFGPDAEWIEEPDYEVDPGGADRFYSAIRRYWPDLRDGELQPDYAGVRPKLYRPGEPSADFRIDGPQRHGIDGLVNLFGIESPGLTACLAIADHVAELLAEGCGSTAM